MPTVIRRMLRLGLALAYLVGVSAQFVPSSRAMAQLGVAIALPDGCAAPEAPRPGPMPLCIDHLGCLAIPALPSAPAALAIPFRWTSVAYQFRATLLSGISVEPELSPPIVAA